MKEASTDERNAGKFGRIKPKIITIEFRDTSSVFEAYSRHRSGYMSPTASTTLDDFMATVPVGHRLPY